MEDNVIFCPECGQKQSKSNLFCINCGSPLPRETVREQPPQQEHNVPPQQPQSSDPGTAEVTPPSGMPQQGYYPGNMPSQQPQTSDPGTTTVLSPSGMPQQGYYPGNVPSQQPQAYDPGSTTVLPPSGMPQQGYYPGNMPPQQPQTSESETTTVLPPSGAPQQGYYPGNMPPQQGFAPGKTDDVPQFRPQGSPADNSFAQYSIPGQLPDSEKKKKKKGKGLLIAVISIIAVLVIGGGAVAGIYFAGGFDSFLNGGSSSDEDEEDEADESDKDKDKDKETDGDETDEPKDGTEEATDDKSSETSDDPVDPVPAKDLHFVCDFEAFSNGEATLTAKKDFGTYTGYQFKVPADAVLQICRDYVLQSLDSMKFLDSVDDYENDDHTVAAAAIGYSGDEEIECFDDEEKDFYDVAVELEINIDDSEDYAVVKIYAARGIGFKDNGDRTTFDRESLSSEDTEVGSVAIDIKGQLNIDGYLSEWVPEGYSMGIEIYVFSESGVVLDMTPAVLIDNEDVISYDARLHTLTAVGPGTATITAGVGDVFDSYTISVYQINDIGNSMSADPVEVDIPYGADPFYFTTSLAMDFTLGGDTMYVNVMTISGVEVTEYGTWYEDDMGNDVIDITFYIDPSKMDLNCDVIALICGFAFYDADGVDYSTDLCAAIALHQ